MISRHPLLLLVLVLLLPRSTSAMQIRMRLKPSSSPAKQSTVTAAAIAGTWVGGPTDTTFTALAGMANSDTLKLNPDSTYNWTRQGRKLEVDQTAPAGHKWRSLTDSTVVWRDGSGYNLKFEGETLSLISVQADSSTGKKKYVRLTRISK